MSYLNSKPLIEGLAELLPEARLTLDLPSRLADGLARGELDVALIPSIEAFADPGYEIISDACVATRGPVLSVKLYFRVPPGDVRTLALDEGSRTSAALARIMLYERFGATPEIEPLPMGDGLDDTPADGVLLIGDRAMHPPRESFVTTWDLGEEWLRWTGLPFVFAMWVGRSEFVPGPVADALARARDQGVQEIPRIAAREAARLGISAQLAVEYLSRNLHFRLGSAERSGLALFRQLAARLGLAPAGGGPRFRPVPQRIVESPSMAGVLRR
ncbi:MAG: menaquinone biosynthetic enzyme MqnA/MqnD family protein [Planctomycetaceae bacterium]